MVNDFFLTTWFLEAMRWINSNVNSIVLTIIIATVAIRLLTLFSDIKTRKSSAKMALVQPDIQKIQQKYKDDPQRAQREQQKLMKERGVSMWGSCLPLLITMPLFFCFVAAFRFWGYEMTLRLLVEENALAIFESYEFLWVKNIWQPDNGLSPVIMDASTFLSTKDISNLLYLRDNPGVWEKLTELGIAVKQFIVNNDGVMEEVYKITNSEAAIAAYNTAMKPFTDLYAGQNNGWFIMALLNAGLGFVSMKMTPSSQAGAQQQQGKMMMYMMPLMYGFFCLTSNAAFSLYWSISSILMIIINFILNKKMPATALVNGEKK